jgi:hypothetical protein
LLTGAALNERLRITSDGKVGVGTSSPVQTLNVNGSFGATGNVVVGPSAGVYGQITVNKTDVLDASDVPSSTTIYLTNSSGGTEGDGNYGPSLGFGRINNGLRPGGAIATVQTTSDADQCGLAFLTHSSATTNNTLEEALRITHDGKVGIGTTSPLTDCHIASASNAELRIDSEDGGQRRISLAGTGSNIYYLASTGAPDNAFYIAKGSSEYARIDSSGRLLVGTSIALAAGGSTPHVQLVGDAGVAWQSIIRTNATVARSNFVLGQTRAQLHLER